MSTKDTKGTKGTKGTKEWKFTENNGAAPIPDLKPISEFVYRRRVQFKETDASGIAHFSSFFVYAEEAEHAMWRAVGLSVEPRHTQLGWPRASASFDFFKALRFEDEIDVRIRVVGRTAKTFSYQSIVMLGDEIAAIGSTISICVQKVAGQPLKAIDIPAEIAARFEIATPIDPPRRAAATASAPRED